MYEYNFQKPTSCRLLLFVLMQFFCCCYIEVLFDNGNSKTMIIIVIYLYNKTCFFSYLTEDFIIVVKAISFDTAKTYTLLLPNCVN